MGRVRFLFLRILFTRTEHGKQGARAQKPEVCPLRATKRRTRADQPHVPREIHTRRQRAPIAMDGNSNPNDLENETVMAQILKFVGHPDVTATACGGALAMQHIDLRGDRSQSKARRAP